MNEKEYLEYKQRHIKTIKPTRLIFKSIKSFTDLHPNEPINSEIVFEAEVNRLENGKWKIVRMEADVQNEYYGTDDENVVSSDDEKNTTKYNVIGSEYYTEKHYKFSELEKALDEEAYYFFFGGFYEGFHFAMEDNLEKGLMEIGHIEDKENKTDCEIAQELVGESFKWEDKTSFSPILMTEKSLSFDYDKKIFEADVIELKNGFFTYSDDTMIVNENNRYEKDWKKIELDSNKQFEFNKLIDNFDKLTDEYCLEDAKEYYLDDLNLELKNQIINTEKWNLDDFKKLYWYGSFQFLNDEEKLKWVQENILINKEKENISEDTQTSSMKMS